MLGNKDRMPPHGRLPSVVVRLGRGQAIHNKLPAMFENDRQRLVFQILPLFWTEFETAAKRAFRQSGKQIVLVSHTISEEA